MANIPLSMTGLLTDREGFCFMCNLSHCGGPNCWVCIPFEKKIEAYERREVLVGTLWGGCYCNG